MVTQRAKEEEKKREREKVRCLRRPLPFVAPVKVALFEDEFDPTLTIGWLR